MRNGAIACAELYAVSISKVCVRVWPTPLSGTGNMVRVLAPAPPLTWLRRLAGRRWHADAATDAPARHRCDLARSRPGFAVTLMTGWPCTP